MIKFIIVEDDKVFNKQIVDIIERAVFKSNVEYIIESHLKCEPKLKDNIRDCSIQKIYLLDIDLNCSVSGLDIAKEIRKNDWDSEIIFITSHDQMFEMVFRTILKVFAFIEKFISFESRLEECIETIISKKSDTGKFCFNSNRINVQIYLKDITYIYRDTTERKLVIKTTNNNFFINMTINNILDSLDDRFKQVHRACIVNTDRVNEYNWSKGYFVLDTREKVNMCSKTFKRSITDEV